MNLIWWIVVLAAGVLVVGFAIAVLVGAKAPPEITGKAMLKKRLKHYGVEPHHLPDECLAEIANVWALKARIMRGDATRNWSEELIRDVDGAALLISMHLREDLEEDDKERWPGPILKKYHVTK